MTTILTYTGQYFDFADPQPDQVDIKDIAHGLSNLCRFNGQCSKFYSVAEHSYHVSVLAEQYDLRSDIIQAAFLHDAAESYLGDLVSPLKEAVSVLNSLENGLLLAISSRFDVDFWSFGKLIHQLDLQLLKAEKRYFWPNDKETWPCLHSTPDHSIPIQCWPPDLAEEMFLSRFNQLFN
jgi:uncharacterized protein